ncbi:hypothetical protein [Bacillus sp. FJAT-45350]|nr:hypothetical protein [Bacillus sp. FJAT-45350]
MSPMDRFYDAWNCYISQCERHGIEVRIRYADFKKSITEEQADLLRAQVR